MSREFQDQSNVGEHENYEGHGNGSRLLRSLRLRNMTPKERRRQAFGQTLADLRATPMTNGERMLLPMRMVAMNPEEREVFQNACLEAVQAARLADEAVMPYVGDEENEKPLDNASSGKIVLQARTLNSYDNALAAEILVLLKWVMNFTRQDKKKRTPQGYDQCVEHLREAKALIEKIDDKKIKDDMWHNYNVTYRELNSVR